MASETRRYAPGEIIFREGEESTAAYVVEVGRVELIKTGKGGLIRLAMLGKGELFGEMGVLDKGPRSATARAEEDCLLQVIPRADFLRMVEDDPSTALKIMTRMARRLRDTDERLASGDETGGSSKSGGGAPGTALVPVSPAVPVASSGGTGVARPQVVVRRGGLINRIVRAFRGGTSQAQQRRPKVVAVTPLSLDPEYDQRPFLMEALTGLEMVELKPTAGDLPPPDEGEVVRDPKRARLAARQMLADEKADLVLWGGEDQTGRVIELFFAGDDKTANPDALGYFPPSTKLVIPADFDATWTPLLKATLLCALGGEQAALPALADAAADLGLHPPAGMSAEEQAAVYAAFGHVAARAAVQGRRRDLLEKAMQAWALALERLPREAEESFSALHRMIGIVLQMRGEKGRSESLLREAAGHYEEALSALQRATEPKAWASLKVRLATVLFRIDMIAGDETALKASLAHYQAALAVYTRAEDPWRWAEVMTAIGQVLQVYGDHLKSVEVLKKSVEVCRSALEVRTAEVVPLLYAATRNNMGSAYFMLARQTEDAEYMRLAAVAFRDALAVHRDTGSTGPLARTIDKNLQRAEDLLQRYESRSVARPAWAAEEAAETSFEAGDDVPPV